MKTKYKLFFNLMVILGICFSLFGTTIPVKAEYTCTWTGDAGNDWFNPGNWSGCSELVPGAADDVVIPDVSIDPAIPRNWDVPAPRANSISVESGAQLTIMGGMAVYAAQWDIYGTLVASMNADYVSLFLEGSGSSSDGGVFTNHPGGTIRGTGPSTGSEFYIYQAFHNAGTVELQYANLILNRGGTHTGVFSGNAGTHLFIGLYASSQIIDFNTGSIISVPNINIRKGTVNINCAYNPPAIGSLLEVSSTDANPYTFKFGSSSNLINMAERMYVSTGKLILEDQATPYRFQKVSLTDASGEINNLGEITINDLFYWYGGKFSGTGTTTISSGTTSISQPATHEIDQQTIINDFSGHLDWWGDHTFKWRCVSK